MPLFLTFKEKCQEKTVTVVEEDILLAKNGDSSLISEAMAQEEEQLLKIREDEEIAKCAASGVAPDLNETQFTRLDELLTQTKLYSEFLLEKMEDITIVIFLFCLFLWFFSSAIRFNIFNWTTCVGFCFARMGSKVRAKKLSPRRLVVDAKEKLLLSTTMLVPFIMFIYHA